MTQARETKILGNLIRHLKSSEADPLTPLIDRYLIERKLHPEKRLRTYTLPIPEAPRPPGRLSPSSVGGCRRRAALQFVGYVPQSVSIDPDTELIFEDGNWRHHKWQAMFADMQAVLGKQTFRLYGIERSAIIPELYVAGRDDAEIRIFKRKYVVDFKGINDYGFTRTYQNIAPHEEHIKQLTTYMIARGIRRGLLLYDNKNNQHTKVYQIEFDLAVWEATERWCERVIADIRRQKLPGRHSNCNSGTFLYERCPFSNLCFGRYKDDPIKMRQLAFRNFEGIDEAWEKGLRDAS